LRAIILWYFLLSLGLYALPKAIVNKIAKSGLPNKDVSIYIKEVGEKGRVIASLNAQKTRTPASVIKVLTTYAALLKLGYDHRFPTKFYTTGTIDNGVLHGDFIIKGFGDPTLSSKDLGSIVSRIKAKGIKKITGNLVIDRSYFKVGNKDSSQFDNYPYSPYNAMPDAMMFNERISTICVTPNRNTVSKKSVDNSYKLINKLQRVNKPCKGRYSWPGVRVDKSQAMPTVLLKGKISKHCGKRNICQVLTKPYKSFYYALHDSLKKAGVHVQGKMRLHKVPSSAKGLFIHYSRPLEQIISKTAKKSNNLYARHLLLYLGAKTYGAPATLYKGRQAIVKILKSKGALASGTLKIDNGSGLSRSAQMSAQILADMYDNAYRRYRERWMKTLSIAGVDGTIRKRFRGTVLKNRAWMKTGTIKRVKNIGGYVKSRSGHLYTAVILVNTNKGGWRAAQLQNDILTWLVKYKGRGGRKRAEDLLKNDPLWSIKIQTSKHSVNLQTDDFATQATIETQESSSVKYYVQAGSFITQPSKSYLKDIEKLALSYKVHHSKKYKVLIGAYKDEKGARAALIKIRKHINRGAFITKL